MSVCSSCGFQFFTGSNFCSSCGAAVLTASSEQETKYGYQQKMYKGVTQTLKQEARRFSSSKFTSSMGGVSAGTLTGSLPHGISGEAIVSNVKTKGSQIISKHKSEKENAAHQSMERRSTWAVTIWTWVYLAVSVLLLFSVPELLLLDALILVIISALILVLVFRRARTLKPYNIWIKILLGIQALFVVWFIIEAPFLTDVFAVFLVLMLVMDVVLMVYGNKKKRK
jgi:membrane-associated HD superfamily phosphohydrolase